MIAKMTIILSLLLCSTATAAAVPCKIVGRLDGIVLDGSSTTKAPPLQRLSVSRGPDKLPANNGMWICEGDTLDAATRVRAILRLGDSADQENEVTLEGEVSLTVYTPGNLFVKIGRIFASVKGLFEIKTSFGLLGVHGTQFSVDAGPRKLEVVGLSGQVGFNADSGNGAATVAPLQVMTVESHDAPAVSKLGDEECRGVVDDNTEVIVKTRPLMPSANVTSRFLPSERGQVMRKARIEQLCRRNATASMTVAEVYADWAQPRQVLLNANSPDGEVSYLISLGTALRLAGEGPRASETFQRALAKNPKSSLALNGLGDVVRDSALVAFGTGDVGAALHLLDRAQTIYEQALNVVQDHRTPNREVFFYNLGDLWLLRGAMDRSIATKAVFRAEQVFLEENSELGAAPSWLVGSARVDMALALTLDEDPLRRDKREQYLQRANEKLQLALMKYPDYSLAAQVTGELFLLRRDLVKAAEYYRKAVAADPHNSAAYLKLASLVPVGERQLYTEAAASVDYSAYRAVVEGRAQATEALLNRMPSAGSAPRRPTEGSINQQNPTPSGFLRCTYTPSSIAVNRGSLTRQPTPDEPGLREVVVTNESGRPISIKAVSILGRQAGLVKTEADKCSGATLARAKDSCIVTVQCAAVTGVQPDAALSIVDSTDKQLGQIGWLEACVPVPKAPAAVCIR